MKLFPLIFSVLIMGCILQSCARKCPADIKIGTLDLSAATEGWLPDAQKVDKMTFTNTAGEKIIFNNTSAPGNKRFQMDIEVLCQRGDYLDKTTQTSYFDAESYHFYYANSDQSYTLAIDMQVNSSSTTGKLADTLFYENFACWGQKLSTPTATGGINTLTDDHNNGTKLPNFVRENSLDFRFVADTIVAGKTLQNVYYNATIGDEIFTVFYTKTKGIEGFSVGGVVWWKD
jgi:hypothetical protein